MVRRRAGTAASVALSLAGLIAMAASGLADENSRPSEERVSPTEDPAKPPLSWRFDGQALAYGNVLARSPNSALNPGNSYVRVPNLALTSELRPNGRVTSDYVDLVLHPRLTGFYENGGVQEQASARGYLQEGFVRLKPTNETSVTAGREVLSWGPAFFRSPSSPYYFNNARLNPITELSGIDLARVSYSAGVNWTVTAGGVFHSGHNLVANDAYRSSLFLKADYKGPDYLTSLILATERGHSLFTGGYAQATLSDAVLAYGEFGFSSQDQPELPQSVSLSQPIFASRRSATALLGGSYTFADGTSLYAEYLYNGFGYTRANENLFIEQARQWQTETSLGGSLGGLAQSNIGIAATRSTNLLGRHYIYLQYQNNPTQGGTVWRLMAAHNITDHSTQLSAYLEQSISDRVSLFALAIGNAGSPNSEFPALFRASVMAGAKVFLF